MESFSGKKFPQNKVEIETLAAIMASLRCASYLEIGSRFGDSFYYLSSRLGAGGLAVSVDLPGSVWGNEKSEPYLLAAVKALKSTRHGVNASALLGDSRDPQIIAEAASRGPFDAVFIDGDHSFEGVRADWESYRPLARKLVAFHDIAADRQPGKKGSKFGVGKLWRKLKAKHSHVEIIGKGSPMGIGVVIL